MMILFLLFDRRRDSMEVLKLPQFLECAIQIIGIFYIAILRI